MTDPGFDVAIVGGGLGGSASAALLGRAGLRVALLDLHARYPRDFRVEKVAGDQIALLERLGLLESVAAGSSPFREVVNVHAGRVLDRTRSQHYGISYEDLVAIVRARVPPEVRFLVGRVADVEAGPDRQRVLLSNGAAIEARLVVLATGLGHSLRERLGISRRVLFPGHSVTFGFDLVLASGTLPFPSLTHYGERLADRIDYLSLFPVGAATRANLFTFRSPRDPWCAAFRREPKRHLLAAMPGLGSFLGAFEIPGPVEVGVMDLYVVEGHRRDGVVLIGDAFQTSCPAAGTGASRVLSDVDRLLAHVERWLATPGMGAGKIAAFYDDPLKRAMDAKAARLARYRRALTVDPSLAWEFHRRRVRLRRKVVGWVRQATAPRIRSRS